MNADLLFEVAEIVDRHFPCYTSAARLAAVVELEAFVSGREATVKAGEQS